MRDRCPTCGEPVKVVTSDEGTSHYESVAAKRIKELEAALRDIAANCPDPGWAGQARLALPFWRWDESEGMKDENRDRELARREIDLEMALGHGRKCYTPEEGGRENARMDSIRRDLRWVRRERAALVEPAPSSEGERS